MGDRNGFPRWRPCGCVWPAWASSRGLPAWPCAGTALGLSRRVVLPRQPRAPSPAFTFLCGLAFLNRLRPASHSDHKQGTISSCPSLRSFPNSRGLGDLEAAAGLPGAGLLRGICGRFSGEWLKRMRRGVDGGTCRATCLPPWTGNFLGRAVNRLSLPSPAWPGHTAGSH